MSPQIKSVGNETYMALVGVLREVSREPSLTTLPNFWEFSAKRFRAFEFYLL